MTSENQQNLMSYPRCCHLPWLCVRMIDVFVGLPTGFGKSQVYQAIPVCYQFLVNKEPIAIVISPLLSLCRNQVQALTDIGMKAVYLGDVNDDDTRKKLKAGQLCSFIPVPRWF